MYMLKCVDSEYQKGYKIINHYNNVICLFAPSGARNKGNKGFRLNEL